MADVQARQLYGVLTQVYVDATLTGSGTSTDPLSVVGGGGGSGAWGLITGTLSDQTDLQTALDAKAAIADIAELAQDAIGTILVDSSSIDFTYTDATPAITAVVKSSSITNTMLAGSIAASKLVGTDIATVGTLTSGSLGSGFTTVAVARGGTGATSFVTNQILLGNGTGAISGMSFGTGNQLLGMNNGGSANEYKTLSIGTTAQSNDLGWVLSGANAIVLHVPDASATVRGVMTTGAQTFAGVKTFSSIPVGPASDPTTDNQFARKAYVDAIAQSVNPGLYKNACTCATTTNITLSGEQTIDGFATSATRVLVKDQTTTSQNGIYISDSGAWTRASDYNTAAEVIQGTSTFVLDGSTNVDKLFVMNAATVTTLGTDPITFTPIVSLTSYDAGTLIDITGSTISFTGTTDTLPAGSTNFFITDGDKGDITVSSSGTVWSIDNAAVTFAKMQDIAANKLIGRTGSSGSPTEITVGAGLTFNGSTLSAETVSSGDVGYIQFSDGLDGFDSDFRFYYTFATQTLLLDGGVLTANQVNATSDINAPIMFQNGEQVAVLGQNLSDFTNDVPFGRATDIQIFTSDGTWTKPTGTPKTVLIIGIGGGGGGGSGRKGAAATVRAGGAGGGGAGYVSQTFVASILSATESVVIGQGGAGGASRTTSDTSGATGTAGTRTRFGGWLAAGGGAGGSGGGVSAATGGIGGIGFLATAGAQGASSSGSGGAGSIASSTQYQPAGGGSGGGITTGNAASSGGQGGGVGIGAVGGQNTGYASPLNGASGGGISTNGSNAVDAPTNSAVGGPGGGGGGSSTSTNAGSGGNGGLYGGGGGGGGAAVNGVGNSGAGGAGANGICIVITYY